MGWSLQLRKDLQLRIAEIPDSASPITRYAKVFYVGSDSPRAPDSRGLRFALPYLGLFSLIYFSSHLAIFSSVQELEALEEIDARART